MQPSWREKENIGFPFLVAVCFAYLVCKHLGLLQTPSALHTIMLTPCATCFLSENPEFSSTLLVPLGSLSKETSLLSQAFFFSFSAFQCF